MLVVAGTLSASNRPESTITKKPWQWTMEERIAARVDAGAARRRIETLKSKGADARLRIMTDAQSTQAAQEPKDYIDGRAHPELFFPHEILALFLRSAYGAEDEAAAGFRTSASDAAIHLGLPGDFMTVFEQRAATLIALELRETALRDALSDGNGDLRTASELRMLTSEQCAARIVAIQELRELYGDRIDEFLYVALAPGMSRIVMGSFETAHDFRRAARGCR